MRGGLGTAVRLEAAKVVRQRLPWLLLVTAGGGAALAPLLLHTADEIARIRGFQVVPRSGFETLSTGVWVGFFLGSILLASLTAASLAGEAARGTMRTALAGAMSRKDWFLAKVLVLCGTGLVVAISVWLLAAATCAATVGFGDVTDKVYPNYVHLPEAEMWRHVGAVALLSLGPVLALVGLGLVVSSLTDEPVIALAVTLGTVLLCPVVGGLADGMGPYLVFSYTGEWLGHLREIAGGDTAAIARVRITPGNVLPPLGVAIVAGALALVLFRRRDILA